MPNCKPDIRIIWGDDTGSVELPDCGPDRRHDGDP